MKATLKVPNPKRVKILLILWFTFVPLIIPLLTSWFFFIQRERTLYSFLANVTTIPAEAAEIRFPFLADLSVNRRLDEAAWRLIALVQGERPRKEREVKTTQNDHPPAELDDFDPERDTPGEDAGVSVTEAEVLAMQELILAAREVEGSLSPDEEAESEELEGENDLPPLSDGAAVVSVASAGTDQWVADNSVWESGWGDPGEKEDEGVVTLPGDRVVGLLASAAAGRLEEERQRKERVYLSQREGVEGGIGVPQREEKGADLNRKRVLSTPSANIRGTVFGFGGGFGGAAEAKEFPLMEAEVRLAGDETAAYTDEKGQFSLEKRGYGGVSFLEYSHPDFVTALVPVWSAEDEQIDIVLFSKEFIEGTYDSVIGLRSDSAGTLWGTVYQRIDGEALLPSSGAKIRLSTEYDRIVYFDEKGFPDLSLQATSSSGMYYVLNAQKGLAEITVDYPDGRVDSQTLFVSDGGRLHYIDLGLE
ncbi:MAG: hypothetical protein HY391_00270 [Deltaproteobacteria bacterium]|nr:hypothetical protein [Deltaproteobacteria bacterium]